MLKRIILGATVVLFCLPAPAQEPFPNTPAGLEKLLDHLWAVTQSGPSQEASRAIQNLVLPSPEAWFHRAFGAKEGARLATEYGQAAAEWNTTLPQTLLRINQATNRGEMTYTGKFNSSLQASLTLAVYGAMKNKTPIYTLWFSRKGAGEAMPLGSFVYADAAFRFLGNIVVTVSNKEARVAVLPLSAQFEPPTPVKVARPQYPSLAKQARIGGVVTIMGRITADGSVKDIEVVSGHPILVQSALNAVRTWRYSPAKLNGEILELLSTFQIDYSFSN